MRVSKGLRQAYELQDFCHEAALALREALTKDGKLSVTREDAQAVKALIGSWRECQERIAFHRRVPAVRAVEPPQPKRSRRSKGAESFHWADPTATLVAANTSMAAK